MLVVAVVVVTVVVGDSVTLLEEVRVLVTVVDCTSGVIIEEMTKTGAVLICVMYLVEVMVVYPIVSMKRVLVLTIT